MILAVHDGFELLLFVEERTGGFGVVEGHGTFLNDFGGAGGLTRILPSVWDMNTRLHDIPDSVEEFIGFCKEKDLLGGDYLGYGSAIAVILFLLVVALAALLLYLRQRAMWTEIGAGA